MLHWVASQVTARGKWCLIPQSSSSSSMLTSLLRYLCQQKGDIAHTHRNSRIPWRRSLPSTCSTQSFTSVSMGLVNATSTTTSLFTLASPSTCVEKMLVRPGSQYSFCLSLFRHQKGRYYERLWWTMAECEQNVSFREESAHKELAFPFLCHCSYSKENLPVCQCQDCPGWCFFSQALESHPLRDIQLSPGLFCL